MTHRRLSRVLANGFIISCIVILLVSFYPAYGIAPADPEARVRSRQPSTTRIKGDVEIIGFSTQGRPLEIYRFGAGPHGRLIVAGIHGGYESNTVRLAHELIAFLNRFPEIVPPQVTLYILPVLNPDGLARSEYYEGRFNANKVDLNRNFPAAWQPDWPNPGCWNHLPSSGGSGPASEPETQALIAFFDNHRITAMLSYHSAADGLYPGGLPLDLDSIELAQSIAAVTNFPYPPAESGCQLTGTLPDWAAAHGIPAVDVELPDHEGTFLAQNLLVLHSLHSWYPSVGRR